MHFDPQFFADRQSDFLKEQARLREQNSAQAVQARVPPVPVARVEPPAPAKPEAADTPDFAGVPDRLEILGHYDDLAADAVRERRKV